MRPRFKTITHVAALVLAGIAGFALTPAGQSVIAQYPKISVIFTLAAGLCALYHVPVTN